MALQKAICKKKKSFFQEKIGKNADNSMELWKALGSLGMKSGTVNQSKIASKNNDALQFEHTKNANIFKDFYSDLAGKLVRKLSFALTKINNNLTKQYYMNIENFNFELCNTTLETSMKSCKFIYKAIFISYQSTIAKLKPLFKKGAKSDRKIAGSSHCYLLCLRY